MKVTLVFCLFALANGFPTSPMESVSSGLVAMIHGQGKASRSTGTAPVPIGSNVPLTQSSPIALQDQLSSTVLPLLVSSPASMMISSTVPPPLPIALNPSGISSGVSNQPLIPPQQAVLSPSLQSVSLASSNVSKQGLFPSQITSLPGALASQMQGQMSSMQQQVTQVGGSLISQTQDQMSSLQSQMASIPSTLGSLVPSGLVPQRAPVSTVSPSIVSTTILPIPAVVTSPPSVLPITSQLPITVQSQ